MALVAACGRPAASVDTGAGGVAAAVPAEGARVERLAPHPELATIAARPCDVVVGPEQAPRLASILNGPGREFCFEPGDYTCPHGDAPRCRGAAPEWIEIHAGGRPGAPKTLRPRSDPGVHAFHRAPQERVVLPGLAFRSVRHWRVRGLVVRPRRVRKSRSIVKLDRVKDSVFDANWIDGSRLGTRGAGVYEGLQCQTDCDRNFIQRNLFTDPPAEAEADINAISLVASSRPGLDHDGNFILDNECRNWSCVNLSTHLAPHAKNPRRNCFDPVFGLKSFARNTRIEGNDAWVSRDRYYSCTRGQGHAPDPTQGELDECACTEAFYESKHFPGPGFENRWKGNRAWGARPGQRSAPGFRACGGSAHVGAGFSSGNACHGFEVVEDNRFWDVSSFGIGVNSRSGHVRVTDNLVFDVKRVMTPKGARFPVRGAGVAIHFFEGTRSASAYRNRIVADPARGFRVANSFEDGCEELDARCNVVVAPDNVRGPGGRRGAAVSTRHNFFYAEGDASRVAFNLTDCKGGRDGNGTGDGRCEDGAGAVDRVYRSVADAAMQELCIEHRRWTGPRTVCVANAATTPASPHAPERHPEQCGR